MTNEVKNFVGGEFVDAQSGAVSELVNPSQGKCLLPRQFRAPLELAYFDMLDRFLVDRFFDDEERSAGVASPVKASGSPRSSKRGQLRELSRTEAARCLYSTSKVKGRSINAPALNRVNEY